MKRRLIITPAEAAREAGDPIRPHDPYAAAKHARYLEVGPVYHIISRTRGNQFLLRPDHCGLLRETLVGILAYAGEKFTNIANYGTSALSNHMHNLLGVLHGDPRRLADYMAFIKRELTRRWRKEVDWPGSMFEGYVCTAIVTPAAQERALRYVCTQGVKEGLVKTPQQWPGLNCTESLLTGEPLRGFWLDGTKYGKALHAEKAKKNPSAVDANRFKKPKTLTFDRLPAWAGLSDQEHRQRMQAMVDDIVAEGKQLRNGKPVLGVDAICSQNTRTSRLPPDPPWFERRRHMIYWDNPTNAAVKAYVERYWSYQVTYRTAARSWRTRRGPTGYGFPSLCFVGGKRPRPIAHMEQSTG